METSSSDFSEQQSDSSGIDPDPPVVFDPSTFDLVRTAICVCDVHGSVTYSNAAARALCGDVVRPGAVLGFFGMDGALQEGRDTPIAQAIRLGGSGQETELVLETQYGDPVRVTAHIDVLEDARHRIAGVILNFYGDKSGEAERAQLSASNWQVREALEAFPTAVYMTDLSGRLTYYNQACVDLSGHTPRIGDDSWCVSWRLYWPDGTPMQHNECPMAVALKEKRSAHAAEILIARPDGTRASCLAYPTPLRDAQGRVIGAINIIMDVTKRKQADEHQQFLINELNHRVKNTLATVLAIAAQSFRNSANNEVYPWFEGRLIALSNAHDVLAKENWVAADLHEIVAQTTAPLLAPAHRRFKISGPKVRLSPKTALSLAMALHELCTNAAKYGALSNDAGQVSVRWRVAGEGGDCRLLLEWTEQGGPPVLTPKRRGFGSRLIERGLARELGGEVRLAYAPSGVTCEIRTPL